MPQRFKVFISSPADVPAERLRADLVCDKISQDYSRFLTLETFRWEHEPMLASGHFQDAIEPPSRADIVLLILWSRLGTPLPEKTGAREYRGIDGRAPVTGTEWEFEEALASARSRGAPDILVFRNVSPAPVDPRDPDARARSLAQLEALDAFWKRHFTDRGVFLAAFDEYRTLDEFASRLEESMRKLIERKIQGAAATPGVPAPPVWSAAPFRGLEPYEFEHAPIFFGRDALVAKAAEQLSARARAGSAFLLVTGASGSGKSSLVKAALIPRLMKPQRISGAAFLSRAVFRPGDARQDIVRGLVDALVTPTAPGVGLPELVGAGQSAEDLARHLRASADEPGYPFAGALGRLTAHERATGRILGYEEAKLILLIDQLEELFTSDQIRDDDRRLFVLLLAGLARSGQVWVIATVRADFWHRAAQVPELITLSEGLARIEIPPPGPAELAEIIRKPAAAAGIGFETHPETRIGLDALIAEHAASGPGVLPLLSFTLDALYAEDVAKRGGRELTYRTYEELGGLEGAIAKRAEAIVSELPEGARAAIPRILRALTTVDWGAEQTAVARSAPLSGFAPGSDARKAIDALTVARLLVATGEGGEERVRLAHEALIGRWQRAKSQLVADRRDLETRALVERQLLRWRAASGSARSQLYLRDPDLANALDLEHRWSDELDQDMRGFIAASRQRARRRQRMVAAAAAVFALMALIASVLGFVAQRAQQQAEQERVRAEKNYTAAKDAVESLIFDITLGVTGLRIETIDRILKTVERTVEQLLGQVERDPRLDADRVAMFDGFATSYLGAGDLKRAGEAADRSLVLSREAAARYPDQSRWQWAVWLSHNRVGQVKSLLGDPPGARTAYEEGLKVGRALIAREPGNPTWKRELAVNLNRIGDEKFDARDLEEARAAYQESLEAIRALLAAAPDNAELREDLSHGLGRLGLLKLSTGDTEGARDDYEEALKLRREVFATTPADTDRQHAIAVMLERLGDLKRSTGDVAGARTAYEESVALMRRLVGSDPQRGDWQRGLALDLFRLGDLSRKADDLAGADATYREGLDVYRKLAERTGDVLQWRVDLWLALKEVASLKLAMHDTASARTALTEAVEAGGKLAAANPHNALWLRELWLQYDNLGTLETEDRNTKGALAAFEGGLAVGRRLIGLSPTNNRWEPSLADALYKIGETKRKRGDKDGARAALAEALTVVEKLEQESRLTEQQSDWPKLVRKAIADLAAPVR